jgi:tRNA (guanosine-2'-O-)-methyltransferase
LTSQRVTQGCERWLDLTQHPSVEDCLAALRARDFRVYVATMDGTLGPEDLASIPRAAVVFGNEHSGVSGAAEALADGRYRIPMRGFSQSLNVSVAAAITLYYATAGRPGDLEDRDRQQLRARFMMLSVPRADEVIARRLDARTHE